MHRTSRLLSGLLTLGLAWGLAAQAPDPDRIPGLIKQLADDSFKVRKTAKAELEKLGAAAVPALKKACQNPDPEVAAAARELYVKLHGPDLLATTDLAAYYAPDELLFLHLPRAEQVRAGLRQMPLTRLLQEPAAAAFRTALRDKFQQEFRHEEAGPMLSALVMSTGGPLAVGFHGGANANFDFGRVLGILSFASPESAATAFARLPVDADEPVIVTPGIQARSDTPWNCIVQGGSIVAFSFQQHRNGDEDGKQVPTLIKHLERPPQDSLLQQAGYRDLLKWAGTEQGYGRLVVTPQVMELFKQVRLDTVLGLRVGMELQATESITREYGEHTRARLWVPPGQEVGSVLAALRPVPLTRQSWAKLPAGLSGFVTLNYADHGKAFAQLLTAVRLLDEREVQRFERDLGQIQEQFGVDLRTELLDLIDGEVTVALGCRPLPPATDAEHHRELPLTVDLALFCRVKKPDALEVSLRHLFAFLAKQTRGTLDQREFRGGSLYVVPKDATDGVHEPCFFIQDGWLYVGSTTASITQLRFAPEAAEPKPLIATARCQAALAQLPKDAGLVAYLDPGAQAAVWAPLLPELFDELGLELPVLAPELLTKYLTPATLWVIPAAGNSLELDYRAPLGVHSTLLYGFAGDALDAEE